MYLGHKAYNRKAIPQLSMALVSEHFHEILNRFDSVLAYLHEHLDAADAQELHATYGTRSALEILCNVGKIVDLATQEDSMTKQDEVMKAAYGPLLRSCGKLLQQKPDASLEVYLMFSGLWWDAESYSLHKVIPIFEEGMTRYSDSAQLQFNVGITYLHEANCAYAAKRWEDVLQYITLGSPYLEKARELNPKLSPDATRILRVSRREYDIAQQRLGRSNAAQKRVDRMEN